MANLATEALRFVRGTEQMEGDCCAECKAWLKAQGWRAFFVQPIDWENGEEIDCNYCDDRQVDTEG